MPFKPMLVVLIEAPIALIVLGPLGAICGNGLSTVVYAIMIPEPLPLVL